LVGRGGWRMLSWLGRWVERDELWMGFGGLIIVVVGWWIDVVWGHGGLFEGR
jgi:hypothetical protein